MGVNRRPAAAGTFYPGSERSLKEILDRLFNFPPDNLSKYTPPNMKEVFGIVSPHAGYQYSGYVAAKGYSLLKTYIPSPERVFILGPNHQGLGSIIASSTKEGWQTPLGTVPVDLEGVRKLSNLSKLVDLDDLAHEYEHSIEVQLPLLQYTYGNTFKLLPICMMVQDKHFATELGSVIADLFVPGRDILVASSDFTHYEPHNVALRKDKKLITYIEKLDVEGFYDCIDENKISVCGFGPIATLMTLSKKIGASGGKLLVYMTSGEIIGEYDQVVGYASIALGKW
ncbi:MAG: MEMO1 family protein [Nitrososphaeria archaeon]